MVGAAPHFCLVLNDLFATQLTTDGQGRARPYTLREVAQGTGLSLGYLSKARRGGIAQPSVQTVALLARFFGVSAQVFLAPGTAPAAPEPPSVVDEFVAAASANRLR